MNDADYDLMLSSLMDFAVVFEVPRPDPLRDPPIRVERVLQRDGRTHLWAVRCLGNVLATRGGFEYEPIPSSRSDEFLAAHRFPSLVSAWSAAMRAQALR